MRTIALFALVLMSCNLAQVTPVPVPTPDAVATAHAVHPADFYACEKCHYTDPLFETVPANAVLMVVVEQADIVTSTGEYIETLPANSIVAIQGSQYQYEKLCRINVIEDRWIECEKLMQPRGAN